MKRCNACGRLIEEDALVVVCDDPSPRGICLPSGHYTYEYCPHCGDDDLEDSFNLVDALDIEEEDETSVIVSFGRKSYVLYVDEDGELFCEPHKSEVKTSTAKEEVA